MNRTDEPDACRHAPVSPADHPRTTGSRQAREWKNWRLCSRCGAVAARWQDPREVREYGNNEYFERVWPSWVDAVLRDDATAPELVRVLVEAELCSPLVLMWQRALSAVPDCAATVVEGLEQEQPSLSDAGRKAFIESALHSARGIRDRRAQQLRTQREAEERDADPRHKLNVACTALGSPILLDAVRGFAGNKAESLVAARQLKHLATIEETLGTDVHLSASQSQSLLTAAKASPEYRSRIAGILSTDLENRGFTLVHRDGDALVMNRGPAPVVIGVPATVDRVIVRRTDRPGDPPAVHDNIESAVEAFNQLAARSNESGNPYR